MSKKNLSRTAIEGGRTNGNKDDRYGSHRKERAYVREYCGKVAQDDEYYDHVVIKNRPKVRKNFNDKLAAMSRWLRSNIGQPWNEVRSKVHKLYDSRTTAGRHILYDHLLSSVCDSGESNPRWMWFDFVVDESGILQLTETNRWNRKSKNRQSYKDKHPGNWVSNDELYRWVGLKKVIDYGSVQYWTAEPTRVSWRACHHGDPPRTFRSCYYPSKTVTVMKGTMDYLTKAWTYKPSNERHCFSPSSTNYAQGKKFTKEEMEFWKNLRADCQRLVLYDKNAWKKRRY